MGKNITADPHITTARRSVEHIWKELERTQRNVFKSKAAEAERATNEALRKRVDAEADHAREVADYAQDELRKLGKV